MRFASRGNGLIEYAIPLVIFTLGGTALMNTTDVPSMLRDFFTDTAAGFSNNQSVSVKPFGEAALPQTTVVTQGGVLTGVQGVGQVHVTLADGTQIDLSQYSLDLSKTVETSGANGATQLLLANLELFSQQLLASGEITADQAKTLKDLANKGYEMAELQALIEEAIINAGNNPALLQVESIHYEGGTYTPENIANSLGYYGTLPPGYLTDFANTPTNPGSHLEEFLDLYHHLQSVAPLENPALTSVLDNLVGDIARVSGNLENQVDEVVDYDNGTPDQILNQVASQLTNTNSAGICQTGGHTVEGVSCI